MDIDTVALHLGYTCLLTGAVGVGGAVLASQFPREASTIAFQAGRFVFSTKAKVEKLYSNNIAPVVDDIANLFSSERKVEPAPRITLIKEGKVVAAAPTLEVAGELTIDHSTYDMALYRFLDSSPSPLIRADYLSDISDEFKCSQERFINVTLHIEEESFTLNLKEPLDLCIVDNIILDRDFINWWCINRLGMDEPPVDYRVTIIDSTADQHSLGPDDAIKMCLNGYDILERKSACSSEAEKINADDSEDEKNEVCQEKPAPNQTATTSTEPEEEQKVNQRKGWSIFGGSK